MLSVTLTEVGVNKVMITEGFKRPESMRIHIQMAGDATWKTSYSVSVAAADVAFLNVVTQRPNAPIRESDLWPVRGLFCSTPARMQVACRDTGSVRIVVSDKELDTDLCENTVELILFAPFAGPAVEVIDARGCVANSEA